MTRMKIENGALITWQSSVEVLHVLIFSHELAFLTALTYDSTQLFRILATFNTRAMG